MNQTITEQYYNSITLIASSVKQMAANKLCYLLLLLIFSTASVGMYKI